MDDISIIRMAGALVDFLHGMGYGDPDLVRVADAIKGHLTLMHRQESEEPEEAPVSLKKALLSAN